MYIKLFEQFINEGKHECAIRLSAYSIQKNTRFMKEFENLLAQSGCEVEQVTFLDDDMYGGDTNGLGSYEAICNCGDDETKMNLKMLSDKAEQLFKKHFGVFPDDMNYNGSDWLKSSQRDYKRFVSESKDSGLMVYGKSKLDNNEIQKVIDDMGYVAQFNMREGYFLFDAKEEDYDDLEMELSKIFNKQGILARFEGVF